MTAEMMSPTELGLFIDGEWLAGDGRARHEVVNPVTNRPVASLPLATTKDLDRALQAAGRAFPLWRATDPAVRATVLRRAASILRERRETVARAMTLEEGKPLHESLGEVDFSADIIEFTAGEALRVYGTVVPTGSLGRRTLVVSEPIGPVAAFAPWNYPVTVPARKISAALAAGCTIIIKCAEETPSCGVELVRAFADAGVPPGVLNLVFGDPPQVSEHLIRSPIVRKVSFTGSTAVGKHIGALAAAGVKRIMLELGGHAPVLVFADADVDQVARSAVGSKFHNAGQSCGSPTRFYLHETLHDAFVERFSELAAKVNVGDGFAEGVDMGPLANPRRSTAVKRLIDDAVAMGARVATGGHPLPGPGNFFAPTLLADVPDDAGIMNEEPFGPVAVTSRFSTMEEVVAKANSLPYGLGAYVFTSSVETATVVPRALEVGMVGLNAFTLGGADTFFGGVKESGYGSEGGPEAVQGRLTPKLIIQD